MTEQEDNFGGIFLGPYAQQIVNHSKIPVMSIKPDGNGESAMWTLLILTPIRYFAAI
jgi:hypothetical protein